MAVKTKDYTVNISDFTSQGYEINGKGKTAIRIDSTTTIDPKTLTYTITDDKKLVISDGANSIRVSNYTGIKYIKTDYVKTGKKVTFNLYDIISNNKVDNTSNPITTFNDKKFTATSGTNYNDAFDFYDIYTPPTEGKNKDRGLTIKGGKGSDNITGTVGNDKITGGSGENVINVYTTKNFGNDEVLLSKGENLIIKLDTNTTDCTKNAYGYWDYKIDGNDLRINIYSEKGYLESADNHNGDITGTITIKNYLKRDIQASSGSLLIMDSDKNAETAFDLRKYARKFVFLNDTTKLKSYSGNWTNETINATAFVAKDKNGNAITAENTTLDKLNKTKGVTVKTGGTNYKDIVWGSKYADTITGGAGDDSINAHEGNDKITGGEGHNTIYYKKGDGFDTVNLTKGENLEINFKDSDSLSLEDLKFEFVNKNKDLKIYYLDAENKEAGSITLKNFAKSDITNTITKKNSTDTSSVVLSVKKDGDKGILDLRSCIFTKDSDSSTTYIQDLYLTKAAKNYTGSWLSEKIDGSDYTLYTDKKKTIVQTNTAKKGLTINGGAGADEIIGSNYSDTIKAGTGTGDYIEGGTGNDKLYASTTKGSNTTFYFSAGDGKDTVYSGKGNDTLKFSGELSITTSTSKNNKDLIINYTENDSVTIKDYYSVKKGKITGVNPKNTIKYIQVGETKVEIDNIIGKNTIVSRGEYSMYQGGSTVSGTSEDDFIIAKSGVYSITPGNGNDTIYGAEGSTSTYSFSNNTGNKTVYVSNPPSGYSASVGVGHGNDTIYGAPEYSTSFSFTSAMGAKGYGDNTFISRGEGAGVAFYQRGAYEESVFLKSGNDLTFRYYDTSLTFKDYYTFSDELKSKFSMHIYDKNGSIVRIDNKSDLETLITDKGGVLELTNTPTSGNDYIVGTDEKDTIEALAGNDYIDPKGGDDEINLGAGNDFVVQGEGNKSITAVMGNNTINLGSGDNTVTLGTGSDTIISGSGENSFEFLSNDYIDDTYAYGGGNDTLTFKNYELSEFMVDRTGSNIVIKNKSNDENILTINNYNDPAHVLNFKGKNDSTTTNIDNLNTKIGSSSASSAQTLTTGAGDDIIDTGTKDDFINAGEGNNTINLVKATSGNNNTYTYEGGSDTFILPDGIADFSTFILQKDKKNLIVAYNSDFGNNTLTIEDYYDNSGNETSATVKNNISFKIGETVKTLSELIGDGSSVGSVLYCDENHTADASTAGRATTIKGCESADTITGSNYNDYIIGNGGNDNISGGSGDDTYVFDKANWGDYNSTITDSSGSDILQLNITTNGTPMPYFEVALEKEGGNYKVVDGEVQYSVRDLYINKDSNYTFDNAKTYGGIKITDFFTTGKIETIQTLSGGSIKTLSDNVLNIMKKEIANFLYKNNMDSTTDVIDHGTDQQKADLANLYRPILNYTNATQFNTSAVGTDGNDLIIAPSAYYLTVNAGAGNDIIYGSTGSTTAPTYRLESGNNTLYLNNLSGNNTGNTVYLGSGNDTIIGADTSPTTINVPDSYIYAHSDTIGNNTAYFNGGSLKLLCYKAWMWEDSTFTKDGNDLTYRYGTDSITFKDYYTHILDENNKNKFYFNIYDKNGSSTPRGLIFKSFIEEKGGVATYVEGTGTINGTNGNNYIKGSNGNDTINSNGGDDIIYDISGNDTYSTNVNTNTLIIDKAGNDKLIFSNTSGEGNLYDNESEKQIHVVFNVGKTYTSSDGAFEGNVIFLDNDNLDLWKANDTYKGLTVKANAIETIQTHDNCTLTSDNISALAENVAAWLSTYKDGAYSNVSSVLNSNNETDINALIAQFDTANWQSI